MTQKQKTPTTGSGTPTSADDLAGNKLAEMMGDKAGKALENVDKAIAEAQKPKRKVWREKVVLCPICGEESCLLTQRYKYEVEV